MAGPFEVPETEPAVERAGTLPGWIYTSPHVLAVLRDRVFPRTWQYAADAAEVSQPGEVRPLALLPGLLDEPLLLTCDEQGAIHLLSNVCTHRGHLVAAAPGRCRQLRCPYHGRRFALDGRFLSMPGFEGVEGFPRPEDDLPRVPHAAFGPLRFASLDPRVSFEDWIGPVRKRLSWLPLEAFRPQPAKSRDFLVRANWALYCENYLEGFHIPFVHPALAQALEFDAYRVELFEWASLQLGLVRDAADAFELPEDHPDAGMLVGAYYFFLFPNTMLNFYPWGLSLNVVEPLGADRTRVRFRTYLWREERLGRGAGQGLDRVELEDEAVVEAVQRGVGSKLYRGGRFSARHERAVHHFQRLLAGVLRSASAEGNA